AIVWFARGPGGSLTFQSCLQNVGGTACPAVIGGLVGPTAVAVSPDGAHVYVASADSNSVVTFARGAGGELATVQCIEPTGATLCTSAGGNAPALFGANCVAVSPDGANVYVTSGDSGAIVAFGRDTDTGELTFAGCFQNEGGGTDCNDTGGNVSGLS